MTEEQTNPIITEDLEVKEITVAPEAPISPEVPETPEVSEAPLASEDPESSEGPIVLRSEGLIKRYGKRTVVNDVSFTVKQGAAACAARVAQRASTNCINFFIRHILSKRQRASCARRATLFLIPPP